MKQEILRDAVIDKAVEWFGGGGFGCGVAGWDDGVGWGCGGAVGGGAGGGGGAVRGRITGDGVVGLPRSFISAGTASVLVSLWAVPDAPTAELMTDFYQRWQASSDKAQALRQAMLAAMESHPEPKNWAAFTLIGEAE